jgi:ATP-dependent Clp protease ATP-binding subunit ClpB
MVDQPTVEDTISILRGLKDRYELHHDVRIKDATLVSAAILSDRYISDRFLPDKAIDLVDEAGAKLRTEIDSVPAELDEILRRTMQLEIERQALKKEKDAASRERLGRIEAEVANLRAEGDALKARWQLEKESVQALRTLREQIDHVKTEIDQAERAYDLNRAAELKYGKLRDLTAKLAAAESVASSPTKLLKEEVGEEDIAAVVSRWTGVPVSRLLEGEMQKLLHLEEELHQRVIGQDEAVTAVSEAVIRARAGLKDPNRPIGSFIFLGPTGVGKTELARALAEYLFDDEHNMVRIDMSEYQEKHTVARLLGAPPGYVGFEEGGQLTEAIRVMNELRGGFRPEFLNRIDEIIVFHALDEEHLKQIVEIQLASLRQRLADRHIHLTLTDEARTHLVEDRLRPDVRRATAQTSHSKAGGNAPRPADHRRQGSRR